MQVGREGQSKGNADTQNLNQPATGCGLQHGMKIRAQLAVWRWRERRIRSNQWSRRQFP
jgi:hypothetical protein